MNLAVGFDCAEADECAVKHVVPEYSPTEVDEAGALIIAAPPLPDYDSQSWDKLDFENLEQISHAYDVIYNFRSSHSFPLNTFQTTLRGKARRVDPNSIVAQRIKRLPTIITKLQRQKFRLTEIQDIGGCRVVLSSVSRVQKLVKAYEESDLKHQLLIKDDYIAKPKLSGYRGVHLIYSYYSDKKSTYNGLKIEMQFRTALQHAWATAVEVVGRFTGEALKSNQGNRKWKRFFTLMGSEIALREKSPPVPNTPVSRRELISDLRRYAEKVGAIDHLRLYSFALRQKEEIDIEGAHYFLLRLEPRENRILVTGFKRSELELAQIRYQEVERELSSAAGDDVVLVSTDSMDALKRAYPNYFADTHAFINAVNEALENEN